MSVDWDRLEFEAVDLLSRYVRVDTSNPPGRERAACDFLGSVLERENIPFELFDAGNDRVSLRAELSGNGTERPFMLLNHTDVVPAEAEFWTEPPFSGAIKDGYVWGRGALDMKGLGIVQLLVLATLKREGVPLARDVVYFAQADEEAGSEFGMRWIVRNHPETLDAEFVINEGGGGLTEMFGVTQPVFTVAVGEKSPVWLQLTTEGQPGHGSLPHEDNSLERLVRALAQIQEWDSDWVVTPPVATYFQGLKQGRILKSDVDEQAIRSLARRDQRVKALLASTISATTASAGIKHNVIPARSEATLDCRLRPGVKPEDFINNLKLVINDSKVQIEQVHVRSSETNSHQTKLFEVIDEVVRELVEDAVVVPGITLGFTDSSELRNRGQVSYGFSGGLNTPEVARTIHGHDERVSIESIRLNLQAIYEVTRKMCAVPEDRS